MSELILVRHGQASFDSDDYDKLSATGHEQAAILSDYWQSLDQKFDHIYSGSLRRQIETANGIADQIHANDNVILDGFNEYNSHPIIDAYREQHAVADGFDQNGNMKERRFFQNFLESACTRWVNDELEHSELERFADFKARVSDALNEVLSANAKGKRVVVATSGGVIAMIVQQVLGLSDLQAINLNWMVYNTSITRIPFSGSKISLSVFNSIPHLERPGFTDKITYR